MLLSLAAVVMHELRYLSWLGGAHAHPGGHVPGGWLSLLAPVLTVIVAVAFATALAAAARSRTPTPDRRVRMRNLWLIATGGLLAMFACQELVQGALHPDHPFGIHGLLGHGGWTVVPLSLLLGGIVAIAVGVVRELERRWGYAGERLMVWPARARLVHTGAVLPACGRPLAENIAGRSPPLSV